MRDLLIGHPKDLSRRIHFLGATSDQDFLSGMALCDTVVFPYLEVGQSSSGPISQALELGCRVVASRTHTFLQLDRYHRGTMEFFDIGNHLELAARILARPQFDASARFLSFNVETNKAVYLAANGVEFKDPTCQRPRRPLTCQPGGQSTSPIGDLMMRREGEGPRQRAPNGGEAG